MPQFCSKSFFSFFPFCKWRAKQDASVRNIRNTMKIKVSFVSLIKWYLPYKGVWGTLFSGQSTLSFLKLMGLWGWHSPRHSFEDQQEAQILNVGKDSLKILYQVYQWGWWRRAWLGCQINGFHMALPVTSPVILCTSLHLSVPQFLHLPDAVDSCSSL